VIISPTLGAPLWRGALSLFAARGQKAGLASSTEPEGFCANKDIGAKGRVIARLWMLLLNFAGCR